MTVKYLFEERSPRRLGLSLSRRVGSKKSGFSISPKNNTSRRPFDIHARSRINPKIYCYICNITKVELRSRSRSRSSSRSRRKMSLIKLGWTVVRLNRSSGERVKRFSPQFNPVYPPKYVEQFSPIYCWLSYNTISLDKNIIRIILHA
jgi:hypothetical protein